MLAMVRPVSAAFEQALVQDRSGPLPDPAAAAAEHRAYLDALTKAGATLLRLPPAPEAPDSCFVEDTLVVAGGTALLTRPGAPSRRGEVSSVAAALPPWLRVISMPAPATLDGGDVLRLGDVLFVGRSLRTNAEGVRCLREAFEPEGLAVREVEVRQALHLKCHASPIAPDQLLLARGFADPRLFQDQGEIHCVDPAEAYAANAVRIGDTVLIAQGYPGVLDLIAGLGLQPLPVPTTHIARADGSLTCLSVLLPEPATS